MFRTGGGVIRARRQERNKMGSQLTQQKARVYDRNERIAQRERSLHTQLTQSPSVTVLTIAFKRVS